MMGGVLCLVAWTCPGQPAGEMEKTGKPKERMALACRLTEEDQIRRMRLLHQTLLARIDRIIERPTSYELVFERPDSTLSRDLFDFIQFERLCCPWLNFQLTYHPGDGPVSLKLGHSAETKEMVYLVMELDRLPKAR